MVSHFPATSLLTSSLADQVRRVLARAVWLPRGITRDQAKPFPCFQYAEPELQAVGFYLSTRRVAPWGFKKQPSSQEKTGENSPHLLGSIGERESKKNSLREPSGDRYVA